MTNRVHEHLNPSALTRLLSVGRQMQKIQANIMNLVCTSKASKLLGTTRVRVISVGAHSDGTTYYGVVAAEPPKDRLPSAQSAMVHQEEFE